MYSKSTVVEHEISEQLISEPAAGHDRH